MERSSRTSASDATGKVLLVGAGPGDPDLLTMRAFNAIRTADIVVHDGLVDQRILNLIPTGTPRISVAKKRSRHTVPQPGINALLVEKASEGLTVLRLKGGDPFIFGRGGEEAESLSKAGIDVEIVPGISAALGAAAEAVLPLTHREASSAVTFVAGQCKGLSDQNWAGLAGTGRTLVIYMGVATAANIADKLIADGVSPSMPVAIVERATLPGARAMRSLLADLGGLVDREKVESPAVIIVGEVVDRSLAEDRLVALAENAENLA
ncbi:MAG: uroporphyrinogen-III C-methyltransferase [Parasphingopyxis sp.]|uniref:uroporphyrinogen-III C-methyltransferase n=1 Tax=Parasphingopyxis sp. TaxID=1920299 RepID=UPI003FA0EAAB